MSILHQLIIILILTPVLGKYIAKDKRNDLGFKNGFGMINNTGILHVIESIRLSLSFVVQFFFRNLSNDTPINPFLSFFFFYFLLTLYRSKVCLIK